MVVVNEFCFCVKFASQNVKIRFGVLLNETFHVFFQFFFIQTKLMKGTPAAR